MIGKKLGERYSLGVLPAERANATLKETLPAQAKDLARVRAEGAEMIACLVVRADKLAIQLCQSFGLQMTRGGTAVFGLSGADAARLFERLPEHQRSWLETPCGSHETKVLLIAGGIALFSLDTSGGKLAITNVA